MNWKYKLDVANRLKGRDGKVYDLKPGQMLNGADAENIVSRFPHYFIRIATILESNPVMVETPTEELDDTEVAPAEEVKKTNKPADIPVAPVPAPKAEKASKKDAKGDGKKKR